MLKISPIDEDFVSFDMNRLVILLLSEMFVSACTQSDAPVSFAEVLSDAPGIVGEVLQESDRYHVQIMYSRIHRDSLGKPDPQTFTFRHRPDEYFYPASTVKFPVAVLALEACRRLGIDPNATMITDSSRAFHTPVRADTSSANGLPSVAHYIRKIFLVSDNDAFNRLYEFVGPETIHRRMSEWGFPDVRIVHRLALSRTREQNCILNPIHFLDSVGDTLLSLPERIDSMPAILDPPVMIGKGEMKAGILVETPKEFSEKNSFNLRELHDFLMMVIFSGCDTGLKSDLTKEDQVFLKRTMGMLPYQSDFPRYDRTVHYDSYVKFFLFGDQTEQMPDHIQIYNKVGLAYGWLTDNAYIVDEEAGIEFFLTATIWVNDNQIFNDNVYEYDETGFPFLAELGQLIYDLEKRGGEVVE